MTRSMRTEYCGHNFRSRLEARWAVFFNEMTIEWEYEKHKFSRYTPDFYLPRFDVFLEVKPLWNVADVERAKKAPNCFVLAGDIGTPHMYAPHSLYCGAALFDTNTLIPHAFAIVNDELCIQPYVRDDMAQEHRILRDAFHVAYWTFRKPRETPWQVHVSNN